ncbi:endonuclease domain-containing protein [Chryseobacterium sp. MP_3.2]|uniref:endonuclease domain-containing protein n=1 Tax=Chryseobacterium sp. MP_3.2 TaxID=3071712 RepID=UPI002E097569|nr:very-short-patch-repair endonuclease [Chryseobacterium sp. MP_3.2]
MNYELTNIDGITIYRTKPKALPANKDLKQRARDLRKAGVLSEVLFWMQVKNGNFYGIDFDRQRVIGNYIVDFYVKSLDLVIEIDGSSHDEKAEYDDTRQKYLEELGLKVYRIEDYNIKNYLAQSIEKLKEFILLNFSIPSS